MTTNATRRCANCDGLMAFVVLIASLRRSQNEANMRGIRLARDTSVATVDASSMT